MFPDQNISPQRRRYPLAKHHAWGGLALLSLVSAFRFLFPEIPDFIVFPLIGALFLYVLVWLGLTYRYRRDLSERALSAPVDERGGEKSTKKAAKNRLKLEKKKAKAELKQNK